jgi:predicted xylan-binding protein with Ca-dependent carbohydrate-binding module
MDFAHVQRTLGLVLGGLFLGTAFVLMPSGSTQAGEPIRFGMNMGSIDAQTAAGAKPDFGTFWIGPWTPKYGWGGPDAELDRAYETGTTPVIQFYYWGDDISPDCVENGCWSKLHDSWKDRAGWQALAQELVDHLAAHMKGRPALVILETEFNKGGISTYEPFDGYLEEKARFLKAGYPAAQVVLGFGNWGSADWGTFERAAAASDLMGIQAMRGSTRNSLASYEGLINATLDGAKQLRAKFGRPVLVTDIALSTYPEPDYLEHQRRVLSALFSRLNEFRAQGVAGVIYRSYEDNPNFDTNNYFGEAERHWGLAWPGTAGGKPGLKVWADGVRAEREQAASTTSAPPSTTATTSIATTSAPPAAPNGFSYETESFSATTGRRMDDSAASGGAAWNLWANGHLEQTVDVAASGLHELTVWARGNEAGGVRPHMVVSLDGQTVLQADPKAGPYQAFALTRQLASGAHKLRIAFTNDAVVGSEDRNLIVDRATLGPLVRVEAESFATASTGVRQSDSQASAGARWNLWANGHVAQSMRAPSDGAYELRARVQGQLLGGMAPHMVVKVDGVKVGEADPGWGYRDVTLALKGLRMGDHQVRIEFTNDARNASEDRNLLVDRVDLVRVA